MALKLKRIKGTKIHAVVTELSLPVNVSIGSGREHEGRKLIPVMESISIKYGRRGRPRKRPQVLYADTKYNMPINRFYLKRKQIIPDARGIEKEEEVREEGIHELSLQ
ncbi:MAG: hypothetical protein QXX95_08400 [Nitrososphaerales archaeon]